MHLEIASLNISQPIVPIIHVTPNRANIEDVIQTIQKYLSHNTSLLMIRWSWGQGINWC